MSENIKVIYDTGTIQKRVKELATAISNDYLDGGIDKIVVVCVLNGAMIFCSDMLKNMSEDITIKVDTIQLSSYGAATESSGSVKTIKDLQGSITGQHVLIVEDIIDSGHTMQDLLNKLLKLNPASIKVCTLLNKTSRRVVTDIPIDYCGFDIGNIFVIGYGLDYNGNFRNLSYIATFSPPMS